MSELVVGVLGATGTVGQRFLQLLEGHEWFRVAALGASAKSAGHKYQDVVRWKLSTPIPAAQAHLVVSECKALHFTACDLVFSALDSSVAGPIEEEFASNGIPVFSNARNHRYDPDVPILIPYVNADHLGMIAQQQRRRGWKKGFIVTNANCSSTGLAIVLKPLHVAFGLDKVMAFTMQAISGAGYPGVASLDIVDNVMPYISGEEPKLETESKKILGLTVDNAFDKDGSGQGFRNETFTISAHCNRVACVDGHTECVSIKLKTPASVDEVSKVLSEFQSTAHEAKLPSAPPQPIVVLKAVDRPQPKLDRNLNRGFTVTVGRVRPCALFDVKFTFCSHNTVIGAAGGSILNAELAVVKGFLKDPR